MNLNRKQRAAFWCERTLNRTLEEVTTAVAILMQKEDERTIREALRQRYKGMPVSTILAEARDILN